MNRLEREGGSRLPPPSLEKETGNVRPGNVRFSVLTRTRVDVGSWICKTRVRVSVLEGHLLLVAPGKRAYVENVPFDAIRESLYNHVTGEVVLGPAEGVKVTRLRMSPLDAARLLGFLHD